MVDLSSSSTEKLGFQEVVRRELDSCFGHAFDYVDWKPTIQPSDSLPTNKVDQITRNEKQTQPHPTLRYLQSVIRDCIGRVKTRTSRFKIFFAQSHIPSYNRFSPCKPFVYDQIDYSGEHGLFDANLFTTRTRDRLVGVAAVCRPGSIKSGHPNPLHRTHDFVKIFPEHQVKSSWGCALALNTGSANVPSPPASKLYGVDDVPSSMKNPNKDYCDETYAKRKNLGICIVAHAWTRRKLSLGNVIKSHLQSNIGHRC